MLDAIFIMRFQIGYVLFFLLVCCSEKKESLFSNITGKSGIDFSNDLVFTEKLNPYTYRNFYNGAGVAIGDINNDGLGDIYFTGNQVDNKLYLNEGNLKFKDITSTAGVSCPGVWSTGVTFVDINADGLLDIYVCKSGNPDAPIRYNELFINNGDLTFTERSKEYGLNVKGLSVQASFFDYDKDGDLDCYLLTNSIKSVGNYDLVKGLREIPDSLNGGNKFFVNDNGHFKDYSKEAGIYRSSIGFGLGITLGDFNDDSWTDIFISNDFFERDYLYINNQNGTFTESLTDYFQSISMGSMGADFADLDNDGYAELLVTEMLPDSLSRKKSKTVYEGWDKYQLNVDNGYYHQFSRNVLQKRIGKNNYAEIGRLAGVSASEWSWGALIFDMDNDGWRDIFIANGIYKDLLDRDYLAYTGAEENIRRMVKEEKDAILKLIELMPSSRFPNYAFRNSGNLNFTNNTSNWGLSEPMVSCGSAYGDLDNDGDLDLVVNNINSPSVIYRNNSDTAVNRFITIALSDTTQNTFSIGSTATVYYENKMTRIDNFTSRGFQSSVQPILHIGLGKNVLYLDSIEIKWPDNTLTRLKNIKSNQILRVDKSLSQVENTSLANNELGSSILTFRKEATTFKHVTSGLIDFNRDRLLPFMYSNESPGLTKGDINGDAKSELYVGGGKGQSGVFFEFSETGYSILKQNKAINNSLPEETQSLLVDVDNDRDLDLYLASGGRFYPNSSTVLIDKIYLNDGQGNFYESRNPLPFSNFISTSSVKAIDFDNDGDEDLLVGERFDPFNYGLGGRAYLLKNDGTGLFEDVTASVVPSLVGIGMVTDFAVGDFDADGLNDFVVVGDWTPIRYFKNLGKSFSDISNSLGLNNTEGWWHNIKSSDMNGDGITDFVVGNHGMNSFFKKQDRMYVGDLDRNGSVEQVFCTIDNGKYYPISDKDEFLSQFPSLKKELLYYKTYSKKSIDQLFPKRILSETKRFEIRELSSIMLLSDNGKYQKINLPFEGQFSPLYAISIVDLDNDGVMDLLAGGNQFKVKPQFGRYDASSGWFFKGIMDKGKFRFSKGVDLNIKGEIRAIDWVRAGNKLYVVFAKHNDVLEICQFN